MSHAVERNMPDDQLALLAGFVGARHDMLAMSAELHCSAMHGAYVGAFMLLLPDDHYSGEAPFAGPVTAISTDWHQESDDDYHGFVVERRTIEAQPRGGDDWARPFRFDLAGRVAGIEVLRAPFTLDAPEDEPGAAVVYDKYLRFVTDQGAALTLTTAHGSILGEIEIRDGFTLAAGGEAPDAPPRRRAFLQ